MTTYAALIAIADLLGSILRLLLHYRQRSGFYEADNISSYIKFDLYRTFYKTPLLH